VAYVSLGLAAGAAGQGLDLAGEALLDVYPRIVRANVAAPWTEAERQGVADNLIVVVGSDFGRTPGYNPGNGKDHWSITSMLLMGKGIPGNKVIGRTDERHSPILLDPGTLQPAGSGGLRLEPKHVHFHLRQLAGLTGDPVADREFPLLGTENLPLLRA
jgi:hypothetical protein